MSNFYSSCKFKLNLINKNLLSLILKLSLKALVGGIFSFIRGFCFNILGEKVMYDIRNQLY